MPEQPPIEKSRSWLGTIVKIGLFALVIYLLWGFLAVIDWETVVDGFANLSTRAWIGLIVFTGLWIVAEASVLAAVMPGLGLGHAILAFLAPTAAASVIPGPADLVARFGMYNSWGFTSEETGASVTGSFVFNMGAKISLPIFAAIGLRIGGRTNSAIPEIETLAIIAAAGLIAIGFVMAVVLRSEELARSVGHWIGKTAHRIAKPFRIELDGELAKVLAELFVNFQGTAGAIIKARWLPATVAALMAQLLGFVVLLVALRGVGVTSNQLNGALVSSALDEVETIAAPEEITPAIQAAIHTLDR